MREKREWEVFPFSTFQVKKNYPPMTMSENFFLFDDSYPCIILHICYLVTVSGSGEVSAGSISFVVIYVREVTKVSIISRGTLADIVIFFLFENFLILTESLYMTW